MAKYRILTQEGRAKRGQFETVHGIIETPVFMNVGTAAAIKGAVSTEDLEQIKTQVELSNTYHLHVRPGDTLIHELGGFINLCPGTGQSLRIPEDSRYFPWRGFGK